MCSGNKFNQFKSKTLKFYSDYIIQNSISEESNSKGPSQHSSGSCHSSGSSCPCTAPDCPLTTLGRNKYEIKNPFVDESPASHPVWMTRELDVTRWDVPLHKPQSEERINISFDNNIQSRILRKTKTQNSQFYF